MGCVKGRTNLYDEEMVGHKGLAMAIVKYAVQDYATAYKKWLIAEDLGKKGAMLYADTHKFRMEEVERFFFGEWYPALCEIEPSVLLNFAKEKGEEMFLYHIVE